MSTLEKLKDKCSFTGSHFPGWAKATDVNEKGNELKVRCVYNGSEWSEIWNLQHTIWGFEREEYRFLD